MTSLESESLSETADSPRELNHHLYRPGEQLPPQHSHSTLRGAYRLCENKYQEAFQSPMMSSDALPVAQAGNVNPSVASATARPSIVKGHSKAHYGHH